MSTVTAEPLRLARKDVETLCALLRRLASDNGNTIRFKLNGSGHINVCNSDGDPYRLEDGKPFSIPSTPRAHGAWKQTAITNATRVGIIKRRQVDSADRRSKADTLNDERRRLVATITSAERRVAAIDKQLERLT